MEGFSPEIWRWIAAAAGGCVYPFVRPEPTWRRNGAVALIGTAVGILAAPILCDCLAWHGEHSRNGVSAAFGLLGMLCVKVGITTAESTLTPAWVTQIVYRMLGVPSNPQRNISDDPEDDPPAQPRQIRRRRPKRETDDELPQQE